MIDNKKGSILAALGIIVFIIVVIGFLSALYVASSYNTLVIQDETVQEKWGNVETAYQRRADLIPNLVETVKGAATFEKSTMVELAAMRSAANTAKDNTYAAKSPAELQAANSEMSGVLSRLMVVVEAYPQLKANQNFLALQDELSGTENRIKFERDNYNVEVKNYGVMVRSFPRNLIANVFGFDRDKWSTFEADQSAKDAPEVDFSSNN